MSEGKVKYSQMDDLYAIACAPQRDVAYRYLTFLGGSVRGREATAPYMVFLLICSAIRLEVRLNVLSQRRGLSNIDGVTSFPSTVIGVLATSPSDVFQYY